MTFRLGLVGLCVHLEPELAASATRASWLNHGQEVFLDGLRLDAPGYDGTQFAREYRRARMGG